ncbi:hypothetical protein ASPBRDRAFT_258035 [Aspergillus brasiliensis CBS 101740]|uniref:Uncharacterized protein n=1 Tax=Aspergillus brasiliensis (strain CBS 101740 / IMI 381727 / IBT 21946) TaxID=767769 RepID=A0A1L9V2M8_ASPBC|nr:hypothetical protein ASPBRDRAFT_258035 [Aspergillus brasiliensis CBS 101740]
MMRVSVTKMWSGIFIYVTAAWNQRIHVRYILSCRMTFVGVNRTQVFPTLIQSLFLCPKARLLQLEISEEELQGRIRQRKQAIMESEESAWRQRHRRRGYRGLYEREVNQAHLGADFGFLTADGPVISE